MDAHFGDPVADARPIAKVAGFSLTHSSNNPKLRLSIFEPIQPRLKPFGQANREHAMIVSK